MATVVKLKDLSSEFEKFTTISLKAQKKAVVTGITKSIPDLVKSSPVDTGEYANSWDFTQTEEAAILGNYAPHAPIIERGARPFRPPLQPLLAWAKRVLKSPSQPPHYDAAVRALAIGTQRKIQAEGMEPKNILENALPQIIENIKRELGLLG